MSVSDILLGKDPNQLGIYDAQLHSLQVLNAPVDNDDVVNLAYFNIHDIVPFIELPTVLGAVPVNQNAGNEYIFQTTAVHNPPFPGDPYYRTDIWECGMAGFLNTFSGTFDGQPANTQACNPVPVASPLGDGTSVWAIHYKRTYDGGTKGTDSVKAMMVLKDVFQPYIP